MECKTPILIRRKSMSTSARITAQGFYGASTELLGRLPDMLYYKVPCGKCADCLKRYVSAWSARISIAARGFDFPRFVTLTYDDEHLPKDGVSKSDVQKFFKRVRKHFASFDNFVLKYVLISEYGPSEDSTHRPHYHFIGLSNYLIDYAYYWKLGIVTNDELLPERIHYVCSYHITKNFFVPPGKNDNFRLSSRGLGLDEFEKYELENAKDNNWEFVVVDGSRVPIHRYFKDKFEAPPRNEEVVYFPEPPMTRQQVLDYNDRIRVNTESFKKKLMLKKSKFN